VAVAVAATAAHEGGAYDGISATMDVHRELAVLGLRLKDESVTEQLRLKDERINELENRIAEIERWKTNCFPNIWPSCTLVGGDGFRSFESANSGTELQGAAIAEPGMPERETEQQDIQDDVQERDTVADENAGGHDLSYSYRNPHLESTEQHLQQTKTARAPNTGSDDDLGEDMNGLILGPKCAQECFLGKNKKCHHKKEQVTVNKPGEFVAFKATWWHHGFFKHVTDLTYFTLQLFCVPSRQVQCTKRVHRTATRLENYIEGTLDEEVIRGLTRDLVTKWDDNDDQGFSAKKFPPTKKFLGKRIDKTKNRYIQFKHIAKLPRLQRVTTEIEERIGNITIDRVWVIKKTRTDDGFQEWHQDMKSNITMTVIVNVGVVNM
jgi:hypothetical protein